MAAPDIRSLSAFDINKIQQSLNKFLATQGSYRDSPMYDPNQRGFRTQFEEAKRKAAAPRAEFKSGKGYGIEDEYRYMVSQGFKPESMQVAPQQQQTTAPVEEPKTGFTPTYLDTGPDPNNFISRFGGNTETMAHSGLKAVKAAEAAGLSISEIQRMGREQGITFGSGAQEYFKQKQGPSAEDMFASQIKTLQDTFAATLKQQGDRFQEMQRAQEERMEALQQQMRQSAIAQQTRPTAGVKMAEGSGGTAMQIARRGVTGAFGRRGMRISGLNV